ncbi:zf-HC2 domain-containing protein [Arthrobacter sp. MYb227]|uniref:zf-HC2 domain-containing protein n=1 Tax=Arthrobacter sp. MYb227 TaxID=1848601 RepID=UPI0015E47B56|nr:zf-HC2 domain-containing protein [Arthrobacter sp. MYb227]
MKENTGANDTHILLGAYLLGGLHDSERQIFEEHLASCAQCQVELHATSTIPSILNTLDTKEAHLALIPEPELISAAPSQESFQEPAGTISLLSKLASVRRRKRAALGAIAFGSIAASVVLGVFIAPIFAPEARPDVSYSAVNDIGTQINIGMNAKAWGTEVQFRGNKLPTSGLLSLWVIDSQGAAEKAGSWQATTTGSTKLTGATPTPLKEIRSLELRDPEAKVLVKLDARLSKD